MLCLRGDGRMLRRRSLCTQMDVKLLTVGVGVGAGVGVGVGVGFLLE